ncbi:uroporphyrinogen-III synthase [Candidatus Pantoea edessiphila]|uniref:Uroporphyrinogen-III synthase n=1 Tax=Candidatus Pantoea edessiphila TaxID=2044610 RepID=A0A2P5T1C6_9GAMM|nr:uroporphyrinogen-III synthase [Candidatus Pantoea edessiphila]PPI88360.1 uroporphyrinogen-III synthase [Candidatus Pantoea edessiphila]
MTILITRPEPAARDLVLSLRKLGKKAFSFPLIDFIPGNNLNCIPYILTNFLHSNDLVFILSKQALYFANLTLQKASMSWPIDLNYYAIGYSTAIAFKAISKLNIKYPKIREGSEELIELLELNNIKNKIALIFSGNPSRELLKKTLLGFEVKVFFVECYQSVKKKYNGIIEGERLRNLGINTLVVTSSDMLKQLFYLFTEKDRKEWLIKCKILVVSNRLLENAQKLGWKEIYVTESANNKSILKTLSYL